MLKALYLPLRRYKPVDIETGMLREHREAVVVGTALLEHASPDTPLFGDLWRRGDVPCDGECPPRGAEPLGEGHPPPDEHCASRQDASRATGGQLSAGSPQWSYLRGRVCGPTCRYPAIRACRGAPGCNEGPTGWGTDATKRKARELAISGSVAFWYIRTPAMELVHELGELGPLGVKCSQLVWSKASHSLDQEVRRNAVSERIVARTTCKWILGQQELESAMPHVYIPDDGFFTETRDIESSRCKLLPTSG